MKEFKTIITQEPVAETVAKTRRWARKLKQDKERQKYVKALQKAIVAFSKRLHVEEGVEISLEGAGLVMTETELLTSQREPSDLLKQIDITLAVLADTKAIGRWTHY